MRSFRMLVLALSCTLLAGEARADSLQDQIVAMAKATSRVAFRFRRTLAVDSTMSARRVTVEQFDPSTTAGEGWSLVSANGAAPSAKDVAQARKAKRGPTPSYADLAQWFGAPATRADGPPGYVVYRFARLPSGQFKLGSHDASPDTQVEALVNVKGKLPFVERVTMTCSKPFSVMLVASVRAIAVTGQYRQLPDGRVVPAQSSSTIQGSMMGKSGEMHSLATYDGFEPVH